MRTDKLTLLAFSLCPMTDKQAKDVTLADARNAACAFNRIAAEIAAQVPLLLLTLALAFGASGCGNSVSGTYEYKRRAIVHPPYGPAIQFVKTYTYDLSGDGSFSYRLDNGTNVETWSADEEADVNGRWELRAGAVTCYRRDGTVLAEFKREGGDLIDANDNRFRRLAR